MPIGYTKRKLKKVVGTILQLNDTPESIALGMQYDFTGCALVPIFPVIRKSVGKCRYISAGTRHQRYLDGPDIGHFSSS